MQAIELARRMAQLGETEEALRAYALALGGEIAPADTLEAALYTLQNGGDYRLAYTAFVSLYNAGYRRADIRSVLTQAFYEPNVKPLKNRYERNCKLLAKYPYLFKKDFLPFDELPLVFYPYDDNGGYVPFCKAEDRFLGYLNPNDPVVSHNFFKDLEKPILADGVTSQYELEYLHDNVRPSEWVGRENHIYLHYADWGEFCAWLQVWNLKPLLEGEKFVFLIGDELSRYPIDFKAEFGVDYSQYPVKPFGIREINKMIWHTQLSSHNGGDFFNEIFDWHPNLLTDQSVMFDELEKTIADVRDGLSEAHSSTEALAIFEPWENPRLVEEMYRLRNRTDKDILVALYLRESKKNEALDLSSRIVPAIFFQPHFGNIIYEIEADGRGNARLYSEQAERVQNSQIFQGFRYIKTFTPLRRPTTSHGGALNFMWRATTGKLYYLDINAQDASIVGDEIIMRVLNRSYLRDPDDRLYRDSVIVRFEDGKLNPTATFTALAAFLDIPYTDSMTYGSIYGDRDPYKTGETYQNGFGTWGVDKRYDEYENDNERYFLEYFLRDAYETYGYRFKWYDGAAVDKAKVKELLEGFSTIDGLIWKSWKKAFLKSVTIEGLDDSDDVRKQLAESAADEWLKKVHENRCRVTEILLSNPRLINRRGQPLQPTPMLELDPELLETEIYH